MSMLSQRGSALVLILLMVAPLAANQGGEPPAVPGTDTPTVRGAEEFRYLLVEYLGFFEPVGSPGTSLQSQVLSLGASDMQRMYDLFEHPEAIAVMVRVLRDGRRAAQSAVPPEAPEPGSGPEDSGFVGVLPGVNPFPPNYASNAFISFLDSILGIGLTDNKARCTDAFKQAAMIAFAAAKASAEVAHILACDTIIGSCPGVITNSPGCIISNILNGIASTAQAVLNACKTQDERVDSAEIEAVYENSLILIQGLRCFTVAQMRRGHGCNGSDDNCEGTIDECAEDLFPPDLHIDVAVALRPHAVTSKAIAAVALATSASDDCGAVTVGAPTVASIVCKHKDKDCVADIDVTATDDCNNAATATTTVEIERQ